MDWTPIKLRKGGEISFVGEAEGVGGATVRTITAAEVAARWDANDQAAAIELYQGPRFVTTAAFFPDTFDVPQPGALFAAYLPGASSSDVYNLGEGLQQVYSLPIAAPAWSIGTYQAGAAGVPPTASALLPGAALYLLLQGGGAPPTTGSVVVGLI